MKNLTTTGAATRNSFIDNFAFGDKTEAIRSLVEMAHSSRRFDGISSDEFIYERLAFNSQKQARARRFSSQAMYAIA